MKVGVITGGHAFDVIGFHQLFRSLDGLDCYIQSLEEWAVDTDRYRSRYDVLVFYNMHTDLPENCPGGKRTREAIDDLGDGTGIVVFHHGILAFKGDDAWDDIVGIADRTIDGYSHDEVLNVHVEDRKHPITDGVADWALTDETYDFRSVEGEDNQVLLTVDHPNSMSTMAWTRTYRESRVLNFVFGHDDQAWSDETFRMLLGRGIAWCGGN
jgi:hypothetical protein